MPISLPFYDKTIQNLQPDLIHAHFGYDAYKLISLAQKHEIPLVVSFYGSDVSRLPSEFGWKRRYRILASNGSHFIAATDYMKSQLTDLGFPETKISVVRFGLNLKKFEYRENSLNPKKMMMVGRMVEKKDINTLLRPYQTYLKWG